MRRKFVGSTLVVALILMLFGLGTTAATADEPETDEPAVAEPIALAEEVTVTAVAPADPATDGTMTARAAKVITCTGKYDYPHPGTSSSKTKVNAHLTVTCTGTNPADAKRTKVTVKSRMGASGRLGPFSSKSTSNGYAKVGGDLACTTASSWYRAIGSWTVSFPAGYTPSGGGGELMSVTKNFKRNSAGVCVAS